MFDPALRDDLARLLNRLARKGALLRIDRSGTGYRLGGPRSSAREQQDAATWFKDDVVDVARRQGWIRATGPDDRLSELGAQALHAGVLCERAPAADGRPAPRTAAAAARPSASPVRPGRTRSLPAHDRRRHGGHRVGPAAGHMLERLARMRDAKGAPLLSAAQVEAGLRLAGDFQRGQMQPRTTFDWAGAALGVPRRAPGHPQGDNLPETAARAQARVRQALDAAGREFADLLLDICCFERGLEAVEAAQGWPARSGRLLLGLALDRLTRHYGTFEQVPSRSARGGVWRPPSGVPDAHSG
jgi:hypothetical protein